MSKKSRQRQSQQQASQPPSPSIDQETQRLQRYVLMRMPKHFAEQQFIRPAFCKSVFFSYIAGHCDINGKPRK